MRVINTYQFFYGTKLPFSELPDRIHQFLSSQGLKSNRFMYYFEDVVEKGLLPEGSNPVYATHGCERIVKDCPELGNIRIRRGKNRDYARYPFLTNLDGESFPENKLLPLMKKIHKRYGFFSTYLYYSEIDFFGKAFPYEPIYLNADDQISGLPYAPAWSNDCPPNAGISIYRCSLTTDNYIILSVDSLFDGKLRDTTPFYQALRAVLPKMRSYHETFIRPTKEEKAIIDASNLKAAPVLEKCRRFFQERMPTDYKLTEDSDFSGIAKVMKTVAGSCGLSFNRARTGDYKAAKRTPRNAVIYVELSITAEPPAYADLNDPDTWKGVSLVISLQGVGFKHKLYSDVTVPRNRGAIIARLHELFSAYDEFKNDLLNELDSCFEVTPDWFVPSDYFDKEYGGYHY